MAEQEMITIRNKQTGEVRQVPRSQYIEKKPEKGFKGIASDVGESISTFLPALSDMISSIPGGIENIGKYVTSHSPLKTIGGLGAGAAESGAALLSSPQVLTRYIAEKFPALAKRMQESGFGDNDQTYNQPTFYESLMNLEKQTGTSAQTPEEQSVRNLGGLLIGGGLLKKLPNMLTRSGTLAAEQGGQGGDPVHAAILGMAGEMMAKGATHPKTISAVKELPKTMPELAGSAAGSALSSIADIGTLAHVPGLQPTLGALGSYLKHISVAPEKVAQKKLFGDITYADLPRINERIEAAKRLGLTYLTPAEATLNPFEAEKQGQIGRTSTGAKLLYEKGKQRSESEKTAINSLLDTIYDEKTLDPQRKAAYEQTMKATVPEEFIAKFKDDPVIEQAMEELHRDPIYRRSLGIKKKSSNEPIVPQNTFEYWDQVKRVLGDMEESYKAGTGRKPFKKSVIANARRAMVADMDAIEPEYETARNISERQFTREKLEDFFDKRLMTGNNFSNYLKSNKKFNETMNKLNAFPEAQQKLNDMRLLFGELIPSDPSIRTAAQMKRTSMWDARNKLDALKRDLDERYGREHDVATVNLMTNPDWQDILAEYLKNK